MAQWTTGFGPGRVLKPAWAFEVATRFGEHFINRERFEKVSGPHGFGHRTSSIHQSSHFTLFIGECTQRGTRRFLLIPYPGQWNINCGNFRAMDGGFTNNQPSLDSETLRVSPFGLAARATIRPTFKVHPMQALRVPTESECWWLFNGLSTHKPRWSSHPPGAQDGSALTLFLSPVL